MIETFNSQQAADMLQMEKNTLEAWRCRGIGPNYRKVGGRIRYLQEDLNDYLNEVKVCLSPNQD